MATSTWRQITAVMEHIEDVAIINPRFTLLDVGCGEGQYGALVRGAWREATIHGLDARPDGVRYVAAYNHIFDMVLPKLDGIDSHYDLVLLIDVIEHLAKDDGAVVLNELRQHGPLVLATPNGYMAQAGGRFDEHLCGWSIEDFEALDVVEIAVVASRMRPPAAMGPGQIIARFDAT